MGNYLVEQKKEKAGKGFESVLKVLKIKDTDIMVIMACYKEQWDIVEEIYMLNYTDMNNVNNKLEQHKEDYKHIKEHITESQDVRDKVNNNVTNIKNFKEWVKNIESRLEKTISKLDSLPWKILFAVSIPVLISTLLIILKK